MALDLKDLEGQWEKLSSPIGRDLKLNFKKFATDSSLSPTEAAMLSLAVGRAVGFSQLEDWARTSLQALGVEASHIAEVQDSAAIMGMLNSYYKFRGFITKADPAVASEQYGQAGLRMTGLARPVIGKENFEMLALAVSVVNGCETCVVSHEKVLRDAAVLPSKIHDAVRLAASIKGLSEFFQ